VPVLTSPEIITCDNTTYISTRNDSDRSGIIFSVPFFDQSGRYNGMVSAIVLTNALVRLLPDGNSAIVNPASSYVAVGPDAPPHVDAARADIAVGRPSDSLLFSAADPLTLPDPRGRWKVWTGFPDDRFYRSGEYRSLQAQLYYGYGLALVLLAASGTTWFFVSRDMRRSKLAAMRLAAARDDAQRAEAEAVTLAGQLQDLNADISRLNRDLTEKVSMLQAAQDEIVRRGKMAQLGQLTATIAHELRNPMGSIRTTAFLVRRKAAAAVPGIEPLIQRIDSGIHRCDDIITQLLDFARTRAPDFSECGVDQWLAQTLEEEAQAIPDAVAITCELGLGDRAASFDPGRMRRVIANLLANASEAMVGKPGSPLKNPTPDPAIRVTSRLAARGVEITVRDNGPGMDADTLAKIREPLFTTKNFGTGLGIPAVERILELHGGGLDIVSSPGRGATFTAWFPAAQTSAAAA
jgi:signal transduction histidine kinase